MTAHPSSCSGSRIPIKIHRNVDVLFTQDAFLAAELMRSPKIASCIALRLAEDVLLVLPHKTHELIRVLKQAGYPVRIIHPRESSGACDAALPEP